MMAPSRLTLAALSLLGLVNLARGAIHAFLPDSGAGVVAGFDLSQGGQTIIFVLAAVGVSQMGSGLIDLLVAWRYRAFAVALLAVETGRALLVLFIAYAVKPPPHEIPGRLGMVATAVLLSFALAWELSRRFRARAA
jgi:hypothetical protein